MAEGTRYAQLANFVVANKQATATHAETLKQHTELLKTINEQIASLATSVAAISNSMVVLSRTNNQQNVEHGSSSRENLGGKNPEN
jgi:hypothetical protein